jgi:precorrin-4 methylase
VSLSKQAGDKVAFSSRTVVSESRISILYCSLQKNLEFNSTTSATLKEIMECFINIVISTDSRQDVARIHSGERYQEDDVIKR